MKYSYYKIDIIKILVFLIMALHLNFFYLIPDFKISFFKFTDLDWMLTFILCFFVLLRYFRYWTTNLNWKFILAESIFIIMAITSSIAAYNSWKQPILMGIIPQRDLLIFPLFYLSLDILIKNERLSFESILNILYVICILEMIVGFSQVFIGADNFKFTYVLTNERFDSTRLYMEDSLIAIATFISLSYFIKKSSIKHLLFIIFSVLFFATVTKSRMAFLTLVLTLFFGIVFSNNISIMKKISLYILGFIGFIFILNSNMGEMILESIFNKSEVVNSEIRDVGRDFYLSELVKNPLFGAGFVNILWNPSVLGSGINDFIYWVDNGIFGFSYYYGLIGVFLIIVLYIMILNDGIKLYRFSGQNCFVLYIIYLCMGIVTLVIPGMKPLVVLPLLMTLTCTQYDCIKEEMV